VVMGVAISMSRLLGPRTYATVCPQGSSTGSTYRRAPAAIAASTVVATFEVSSVIDAGAGRDSSGRTNPPALFRLV